MDTAYKCLLTHLPPHLRTHCCHHHSEGCSYHHPPLLKERVRRSERNHVSLHQIINGQTLTLSSFFKLTGGRETATGKRSITTFRSHSSKVSVSGDAGLYGIATAAAYAGIIWVVVSDKKKVDTACFRAIALGVTNLTRVGRDQKERAVRNETNC